MWMPKRFRRQIHALTKDADMRLADARNEHDTSRRDSERISRIAATSERLAQDNVAVAIRSALQVSRETGAHRTPRRAGEA